jgi:hypothetical protein
MERQDLGHEGELGDHSWELKPIMLRVGSGHFTGTGSCLSPPPRACRLPPSIVPRGIMCHLARSHVSGVPIYACVPPLHAWTRGLLSPRANATYPAGGRCCLQLPLRHCASELPGRPVCALASGHVRSSRSRDTSIR